MGSCGLEAKTLGCPWQGAGSTEAQPGHLRERGVGPPAAAELLSCDGWWAVVYWCDTRASCMGCHLPPLRQRAMLGSVEVEWSLQPLREALLLGTHPGVERLSRL